MVEITSRIICAQNIAALQELPDNYADSIVTDGPYGLGKEPDPMEVMKDWIEKGYHEVKAKGGFMGKAWDSFVPQPNFWKEVYRVLKPGGHVVSFAGTRTYDWMVMSMRFARFEIRDQLIWAYGSGFPKALDVSKAIDKQAGAEREVVGQNKDILTKQAKDLKNGKRKIADSFNNGALDRNNGFKNVTADITKPQTDEAKQWDGWKTALKPAIEPICLARKPISENTIADNILKWGTGALNIDGCRVGFENEDDFKSATFGRGTDIIGGNYVGATHSTGKTNIEANPTGRFPANFLISHHSDCEFIGMVEMKGTKPHPVFSKKDKYDGYGNISQKKGEIVNYGDENGMEQIQHYNCHPDCPVKILNDQSGLLKTGAMKKHYTYTNTGTSLGAASGQVKSLYEANSGYASRFFYCAKASRSERNKGLENLVADQQNVHPTVKPVKLMQWLVRLVTPAGGICIDPFNGSGTTGIACKLEGINYIGIDDIQEHCDVSVARIASWEPEPQDRKDINLQISIDFGSNKH